MKRYLLIISYLSVIIAISSPAHAQATAGASGQKQIFHEVTGVTFVDALHGWMLASYQVNEAGDTIQTVDVTTDGGQTWQTQSVLCSSPAPKCVAFDYNEDTKAVVRGLRFINLQDGWAFGPDFISTHDGGKTWHKVNVTGSVISLEAVGGMLWAVQGQGACSYFGSYAVSCDSFTLLISKDNGQTWQAEALPSDIKFFIKFVPLDRQTGLLLYVTATVNKLLRVSVNNGKISWQSLSTPGDVGCFDTLEMDIAPVDGQNMWFACGDDAGAGYGAKWLFKSSDGGLIWQLQARAGLPPEPTDLPILGEGYLQHLYAFSSQMAWITSIRGPIVGTNNGGKAWHQTELLGDPDYGGNFVWVDSQHIWFYSPFILLGTSDGGKTWVCERLDSSFGDSPVCRKGNWPTDPRNETPMPGIQ